jgi:VanZ family protein
MTPALKKFFLYWLPVIVYLGIIFFLSSLPDLLAPEKVTHLDKITHFLEYGILSFLLARALTAQAPESWQKNFRLLAVIIAIIYGASDEIHQLFVPGRQCSFFDFVFDSLGALFGQKFYR